jgi:hypothetical protein
VVVPTICSMKPLVLGGRHLCIAQTGALQSRRLRAGQGARGNSGFRALFVGDTQRKQSPSRGQYPPSPGGAANANTMGTLWVGCCNAAMTRLPARQDDQVRFATSSGACDAVPGPRPADKHRWDGTHSRKQSNEALPQTDEACILSIT